MGTITLNQTQLSVLKEGYRKAVNGNLEKFKFQGEFVVTGYAKYLIEYAENELG